MITDNEKGLMIQHFMQQVKTEDLLNIAFMKPFQVAMRTSKNDKTVPTDSLPKGLMLAVKSSINDNKYKLERVKPIEPQHKSLEDIKAKHLDNYISLLKKPEQKDEVEAQRKSQRLSARQSISVQEKEKKHKGLELGICISMKNEDKKKLKSTLVGVADNIDELIKSGVSPDDIFVVVAIDGVSNVDPSLYQYFEEFERESQIYLQEDQKLTIRKKYEHQLYHSEVQKDQPLNFSKFLFKKNEFIERIDSKFVNIRKKYDEILRIKKSIENIKKENNKDNDNLKMIVNRLADKQKVIMKKIVAKQDTSMVISEESIMKELATSQEQCNQYVNTRQELAYVSVYRVPTCSISQDCRLKQLYSQKNEMTQLESQIDSQRLMNDQIDRTSMRQSLKLNSGHVSTSLRYVNIFFCIKYKESGKLSSHNWFLNGFCQQLNPRFTVLLDVGVRPYPDAIFKMYRHLKVNENVGGVCGYLRYVEEMLDDQQRIKEEDVDCMTSLMLNLFDIQRAQQIESHYDHFLDKSFEALFKFIHVVPGSFSAYSMKALRPPEKKDDLLKSYFRTIDEKMVTNKVVPSQFTLGSIVSRIFLPKTLWKRFTTIDPDSEQQMLYDENTYLSENRVLCLGIHKNGKDIAFLPNVYAQVQPIKEINSLMQQKKKELNGGMFSFQKFKEQFDNVTRKRQKFLIKFQFLYLSFTKFITFFAPALLIFGFQYATQVIQQNFLSTLFASESDTGLGNVIYRTFANIITFIYALCILAIFFFSIHLNAKDKKYVYYAHLISTILGVFTVVAAVVFIVQTFMSILKVGDSYVQKDYINALSKIMSPSLALSVARILRVLIYTSIMMIYLPAVTYTLFFGKFGILWEVVMGSPAYIFYLPTYICIMPIYAKCRLDDTSQSSQGKTLKNQKMKETWKIVKMIDVAKYLIWNMIVAGLLIFAHTIMLVKFFIIVFLLFMFTLLSVIKWIPGFIYIIRYKWHKKNFPLEPSQEEKNKNVAKMRLKVMETIKRFEDDFTFNIKESFQQAAIQAEVKELQRKAKLQAKKNAGNGKQTIKVEKPVEIKRNQSINMTNLVEMGQNQAHLRAKVQNIRESYVPKGNFYPFQVGVGKKEPKPINAELTNTPLELVLLKNKFGEINKNPEHKIEEEKLKKYENFRSTIKPLGF